MSVNKACSGSYLPLAAIKDFKIVNLTANTALAICLTVVPSQPIFKYGTENAIDRRYQ